MPSSVENTKPWIENPNELVMTFSILPLSGDTVAEQLNAYTRFIFVIGILAIPISPLGGILFICVGTLFLVLLFYLIKWIHNGAKSKEHYEYIKENFFMDTSERKENMKSRLNTQSNPSTKSSNMETVKVEYYQGQKKPSNCIKSTSNCTINYDNSCLTADTITELVPGPGFFSLNQSLAGKPNPRTAIPPILVPPVASSEWRENAFVVRPGINSETNEDLSRSGYIVSKSTLEKCGDYCGETACCGKDISRKLLESTFIPSVDNVNDNIVVENGYGIDNKKENFNFQKLVEDVEDQAIEQRINGDTGLVGVPFPKLNPLINDSQTQDLFLEPSYQNSVEIPYIIDDANLGDYTFPSSQIEGCDVNLSPKQRQDKNTYYQTRTPNNLIRDSVMTADGYNPENILSNLPTNVSYGDCQRNPAFNEYNKQLHTSTIEPGLYTRNEIEEPISSNIGISFTQQFEPILCEKDCDGNVTYVGKDPNINTENYANSKQLIPYDRQVHLSDIYDPRFSGYGTSYRSYIEPVTGQVRFYYGDVDAYKRPNYISRSNVDFIPSSIGTQAIPNESYFNTQNKHAREIANNTFTEDTATFRSDLQERLMRKANANLSQTRAFPKHKMSFNRGSMSNKRR